MAACPADSQHSKEDTGATGASGRTEGTHLERNRGQDWGEPYTSRSDLLPRVIRKAVRKKIVSS